MFRPVKFNAGDASNDFKMLRLASIVESAVSPDTSSDVRRLLETSRVVKAVRPVSVSDDNLLA